MAHEYLSTACAHEGDDPAMHAACRLTCKFCGAPCQCRQHRPGDAWQPASQVDQARAIAREMLAGVHSYHLPVALRQRIASDPALFWLRDGEVPPGKRAGV